MKNKSSVFAILGLLYFRSMSGYAIKKLSMQTIHYFWNCNFGDIYPILKILLNYGYIIKKDSSVGKKKKDIYTVTAKGKIAFNQWLFEKHDIEEKRIPFLLKIFFSGVNPATLKIHLTNFIYEQQSKLAGLKLVESAIKNIFSKEILDLHNKYISLCISYGLNATSSNIKWATAALNAMN